MGDCEGLSIGIGNWDVFSSEIILIVVASMDHVSDLVRDYIIRACGEIIQELLNRFVGGFSDGGSLLS